MKKLEIDSDITVLKEEDITPTVKSLLSIIDNLREQIATQAKQIEAMSSELKRLKKISPKPKLKPSKLPKESSSSGNNPKTRSQKITKKKPIINKEVIVTANNIPEGSIRKGYRNFIIQDIEIKPVVTKYKLERWLLPDGTYSTAKLPKELSGHHFGPTLRAYIIYQYHHQCVTQPLIYEQLREWNIDISKGQVNNILINNNELFHQEKDDILTAGLSVSRYIQVDDTGARHKGSNGFCTHIGNKLFAWFKSSNSKSRLNFLDLLQQKNKGYYLNAQSFAYMRKNKIPPWIINILKNFSNRLYSDKNSWDLMLDRNKLNKTEQFVRRINEAGLIGNLINNGFSKDTIIISDDAGQFNLFQHALCWVHAERGITTLIPINKRQVEYIKWAKKEVWDIYGLLLKYKDNPNEDAKLTITRKFKAFCKTKIDYPALSLVLKRFYNNRHELLLVLKYPYIPLHNNLSEQDIREYVKRRKISGSTRSDLGQQARDTFASLKKTAKKLKIKFWNYLLDRLYMSNTINKLFKIIQNKNTIINYHGG